MSDAVVPLSAPSSDGRRVHGDRTRQRLLAVARELLAERGEEGVRLRDITEAANANVAAVAYHFGGLSALLQAATIEAVETIVEQLIDGLDSLGDDATVEEVVGAWVRPKIVALQGGSGEAQARTRTLMRIMARVAADPPEELHAWSAEIIDRFRDRLIAHLDRAIPELSLLELRFRVICLEKMIMALSTPTMLAELDHKTPSSVERLLVPLIVGALVGGQTTAGTELDQRRPTRTTPLTARGAPAKVK